MSLTSQAVGGLAPSQATHHEGIVLGLLALIVVIRLVESGRLPAAWGAVFGLMPNQPAAPAPAVKTPQTAR